MYDLASVREVCRDYSAVSARVDRSLQTLRLEMMSLRRQDVALLKQLVTINDVIRSLRAPSRTGSAQPPLLQFNSAYHSQKLADYRARLSCRRSGPEMTPHARTTRACSEILNRVNAVDGKETSVSNQTTVNTSYIATGSVLTDNTIHRKICETQPELLQVTGSDAHVRQRSQTLGRTAKEIKAEFDLRCRTASTDTIASQSDSAYGSGSDLDDSLSFITAHSSQFSSPTISSSRPISHPVPSHNATFLEKPSVTSMSPMSSRYITMGRKEESDDDDNYERILATNMQIWRVSKVKPMVTDL